MSSVHCSVKGCAGELYDGGTCLLHLPEKLWSSYLNTQASPPSFPTMRGVLVNNRDRLVDLLYNVSTGGQLMDFTGACFEVNAPFAHMTFGRALFDNARFSRRADFTAAAAGEISFTGTSFHDELVLADATFDGRVTIRDCTVRGKLDATRARFQKPVAWRSLQAGAVVMDSAVFEARVDIAAATDTLSFAGAQFGSGVTLRLSRGEVVLDGAVLDGPSLITGDSGGVPRVRSLADVDVSTLSVHGGDLSECTFSSVHNLDKIRLSEVIFGEPGRFRTKRRVIAEEAQWRTDPGTAEHPRVIAGVYRSLRKAVEDTKDEPGAADFYFGEMEMRRAARRRDGWSPRALGDYVLLTLYWLLSGYGLRGWRALTALVVMLAVGAVLLAAVGFSAPRATFEPTQVTPWGTLIYQESVPPDHSFVVELPRAIRMAGQSVLSLLTPPAQQLTPGGDWIVLLLRFLGPVLVGLLILAVRNKVKR
jgi:hypothetical protein